MHTQIHQIIFILAGYCCFFLYNKRAYAFCQSILTPIRTPRAGNIASASVNILTLSLVLFCGLPAPLDLVVIYFMVILQFLYLFRGDLTAFIFGSGMFMFHIMNVKMTVTCIFILVYGVPSYAAFRDRGPYFFCSFVTILVLLASLEVFQRIINLQAVQTLMKNHGQLRFVTISMMLINIYLLILSLSYNNQAYSSMAGIFLLSTSLLLFCAFYTSFWHAIKMSAMMENEIKSKRLEEQLQATKENVEALQAFAFTDTLTAVHNRRFGLDRLSELVENQISFCLCFLDIDGLKHVNDTYGHEEGDRYILDVVRVLSGACGKEDTLSRMGGDEFMLLLPRVSQTAAAERMRDVYEAVSNIPSVYHPSFSYGIVEVEAGAKLSVPQILRRADQAMYQFKRMNK